MSEANSMTVGAPLAIVIRIPGVTVSHAELNSSLKLDVDRFEASKHGGSDYAQIDIDESQNPWEATLGRIRYIRGSLCEMVSVGSIGVPVLDIALGLPGSVISRSWTIPAAVAAAAGEAGMSIEISVYLTSDD
jgi:hypothetical protein